MPARFLGGRRTNTTHVQTCARHKSRTNTYNHTCPPKEENKQVQARAHHKRRTDTYKHVAATRREHTHVQTRARPQEENRHHSSRSHEQTKVTISRSAHKNQPKSPRADQFTRTNQSSAAAAAPFGAQSRRPSAWAVDRSTTSSGSASAAQRARSPSGSASGRASRAIEAPRGQIRGAPAAAATWGLGPVGRCSPDLPAGGRHAGQASCSAPTARRRRAARASRRRAARCAPRSR